jgi:CMP-N-acetylneuraminic acid synthetase
MATLAIIPARGGSKRVPDKNVRPFLGTPLLAWTIRFARHFGRFDNIVVSTDSLSIAQVAEAEGISVPWLRPAVLASDTAGAVDMALHALQQEKLSGRKYDSVALLQPTSPVRLLQRWHEAFDHMVEKNFSAAVGFVPAASHPFHTFEIGKSGNARPFIEGGTAQTKLRTQDLPPAYTIAGNLYLVTTAVLENKKTFFPEDTIGIVCDDPCEAFDIDTVADWIAAEAIAKHYEQKPWPRS